MKIKPTGFIRPLSDKPVTRRPIMAFDSEDDSQGKVLLVDFYDGVTHTTFDLETCTPRDIVEWIYSITDSHIFIAHNLEYDLVNIFRDAGWHWLDEMVYTGRLIKASLKRCEHDFWDSFNWAPVALRTIGKWMGQEKGDYVEALAAGKEDLIKYCRSDTEILWKFANGMVDLAANRLGIQASPTIGRMAMDAWRRRYMGRTYAQASHPKYLEAYYGGRTEVFHTGDVTGTLVVADVRSMYPDAMRNNEYPDPGTMVKADIDEAIYGIGEFIIDVPASIWIPPLPVRRDGKLWFPTGRLKGCWTYHEVRYAVSLGCVIIQQNWGHGTNFSCRPFKDYIDMFYAMRCEARTAGNEFEVAFFKLFLNNLYGKYGQHNVRSILTPEPTPQMLRDMDPVRFYGDMVMLQGREEKAAPTSNYLWGCYITSYARIKECQILTAIHTAGHTVLYCDTDSAMYVRNNDVTPYVIGEELGMMDEELFEFGKFVTAKGYMLGRIATAKDLKKDPKLKPGDIIHKYAMKGIPNAQRGEFLTTGKATFRSPVRLKQGFLGDIKANVWREVSKQARTAYGKRATLKTGGPARPWDWSEIIAGKPPGSKRRKERS